MWSAKDGGVEQEEPKQLVVYMGQQGKREHALIYGRRICQLTK
jgi:hypothetical protein